MVAIADVVSQHLGMTRTQAWCRVTVGHPGWTLGLEDECGASGTGSAKGAGRQEAPW